MGAQRIRIHNDDDYERVSLRILELSKASPGSHEEAELLTLLEAVDSWQCHQDQWSDWLQR